VAELAQAFGSAPRFIARWLQRELSRPCGAARTIMAELSLAGKRSQSLVKRLAQASLPAPVRLAGVTQWPPAS